MTMHQNKEDKKRHLKDRLSKVYKLVIIDEENLSHSGSYKGPLSIYLTYIVLTLLATSILTTCLISFTPLRHLIPGYGDIEENEKYLKLKDKMVELEAGVEVQQTYIKGLQNMFRGELDKSELPETMTLDNSPSRVSQVQVITEIDRKDTKSTKGLSQLHFISPLKGSISAKFDAKIKHYGVDVAAEKGKAIKSIASGVVVSSDWSLDAGNMITIQHERNTISVYKHNSVLLKKTGEIVQAGEAVAIIGNSGTLTSGPHLHFELWHEKSPVNPENYISF